MLSIVHYVALNHPHLKDFVNSIQNCIIICRNSEVHGDNDDDYDIDLSEGHDDNEDENDDDDDDTYPAS